MPPKTHPSEAPASLAPEAGAGAAPSAASGKSDALDLAELTSLAAGHAAAADKAADAASNALATTLETADRVSAMHTDILNLLERAERVAQQAVAATTPLVATVEAVSGAPVRSGAQTRPLSDLLQLVKRRTVLSADGAPDRVVETSIAESEVVAHADHGDRIVVVTRDGQKHHWPAPRA